MIIENKDTKKDLRIKRTEKAIRTAFIKLMQKSSFDRILVKDITDEAMISRNTFYLHYADKYDLLDSVCNDLIMKLQCAVYSEIINEPGVFDITYPKKLMLSAYKTIDENRELYKLLLMDESVRVFRLKLRKVCEVLIQDIQGDLSWIDGCSLEYMFDGLVGVIKYWVTHENKDIEKDVENFVKVHFSGIISYLNKSQTAAK